MDAVQANEEKLLSALKWHGLPVWGRPPARTLALEEALALGVGLARRDSAVCRGWPVMFARNRAHVNVGELVRLAGDLGEVRACGFLLWVAAKVMGDEKLLAKAESLRSESLPEPEYFDREQSGRGGDFGRVFRRLSRRKTEEFARRWSFWLGTSFDNFFGECYRKHMGVWDGVQRKTVQ